MRELISIEQFNIQVENSWCSLHWKYQQRQMKIFDKIECSCNLPFETEQTVGQNTLLISHDSVKLIGDHPLANPAGVSLHSPRFNYYKSVSRRPWELRENAKACFPSVSSATIDCSSSPSSCFRTSSFRNVIRRHRSLGSRCDHRLLSIPRYLPIQISNSPPIVVN